MKVLLLPGDGIGPEICAALRPVLAAADDLYGLGLVLETADIGLSALADKGTTLPAGTLESGRAADGIILGPLSTYEYPSAAEGGINASAAFRKELDLYANNRPARNRAGVPAMAADIDMVVMRENTEGFYADRTMFAGSGEFMPTEDLALAIRKVSRKGSARIARQACELAMRRSKRLTVVHKANVLQLTDGLFYRTVCGVAADYPEIAVSEALVDAATSLLIREPSRFDVIVTSNMFGDILSNLTAELAGGLGLAGSLNAGDQHAMAQASHGSAPDIAGQDAANPCSLILSVAMLFEWLGRRHGRDDFMRAAAAIDDAVDGQLAEPDGRTRDLGGSLGTQAFGQYVAARLSKG